jgi:hypothetical protein
MQSKEITDDLIDSSTELAASYGKNRARLMDGVAWIPTNEDTDPWIQVNFVLTVTIIEILTQGRSLYSQWTRNYMVAFAQKADSFQFYLTENNQKKVKLFFKRTNTATFEPFKSDTGGRKEQSVRIREVSIPREVSVLERCPY